MSLSQNDRIAFSLYIVEADAQITGLLRAKSQLQSELTKIQNLDNANKNLFIITPLINEYQVEIGKLDGFLRTTIVEQDMIDAARKQVQNHFFPNDTSVTVPSLSAFHNIWTQLVPFALNYAIGKNYTENYSIITSESDLISAISGFITSAASHFDIENTTGQHCTTGPDTISSFATVQTLKTNTVTAVNNLKTFLLSLVTLIPTDDPNLTNQINNNAAINNINSVIIPALNIWLAYPDFNTAHGQTTCAGFYAFNSNILAPTKLHSTQLAALQTALNNRTSFSTIRISQISAVLGTITQNVSTGEITSSSGFYGQRYSFLDLRLNLFGGSLTKLIGMQSSSSAQDSIIDNIQSTKSTYYGICPTSIFQASGNATPLVHLVDASFLSIGDAVYVTAEKQEELIRAVKFISGNMVTLNDAVPAKYTPSIKARLYKDLT